MEPLVTIRIIGEVQSQIKTEVGERQNTAQ